MDSFTIETQRAKYEATETEGMWTIKWTLGKKIAGETYISAAANTYVAQWIFKFDESFGNYA